MLKNEYRDDTIKIGKLPKLLEEDMAEFDRLYNEEDEMGFLLYADGFEASVKQWLISGKISESDLDAIFRKYGWR